MAEAVRRPMAIGRLVPILAALAAFAPFSTDMYLPGFGRMAESFRTDAGSVEATLSVFFLGIAVGQAFWGPVTDRWGRRGPLLAGVGVFVLATLACLVTDDIGVFTALRALQASGGCAGMIIGRAVVRDRFDPGEVARVLSLLMMIVLLAPIVAPLLGGWIIELAGWRAIFVFLLGFGILCWSLVWFGLPESLPPERRQSLGLGGILLVYLQLVRRPAFIVPALVGGLGQSRMFAFITGSPFVFIQQFGVAERNFGWLFGLIALGLIVSAQVNRMALRRFPPQRVLGWALVAHVVAGLALAATAGSGSLVAILVPLWFAIGTLGFIGPNATALAMVAAGEHAGSGSALVGVLQFGCAAAVSSLVAAGQNGTPYPMSIAITVAGVAAGTLWLAAGRK